MPSFLCYSFTEDQIVVVNQDLTFLFGVTGENLQRYVSICWKYGTLWNNLQLLENYERGKVRKQKFKKICHLMCSKGKEVSGSVHITKDAVSACD